MGGGSHLAQKDTQCYRGDHEDLDPQSPVTTGETLGPGHPNNGLEMLLTNQGVQRAGGDSESCVDSRGQSQRLRMRQSHVR